MTNDITQADSTNTKSATVQLVLTESQSAASSEGSIVGNQTFTKTGSLTFYLKDPCINAVLTPATITAWTAITNGSSGTKTFTKTQDTIEVLNGLNKLCGPRTYTVCSAADCTGGAVNWITITAPTDENANPYTLTASPNQPNNAANIGTNSLWLKQQLTNFAMVTPVYTAFTITVNAVACDCEQLRWVKPTKATQEVNLVVSAGTATSITLVSATPDAASKGASADNAPMRRCAETSTNCAETSTYVIRNKSTGTLPSFITQTGTTAVIAVKATSHLEMGTITLEVV